MADTPRPDQYDREEMIRLRQEAIAAHQASTPPTNRGRIVWWLNVILSPLMALMFTVLSVLFMGEAIRVTGTPLQNDDLAGASVMMFLCSLPFWGLTWMFFRALRTTSKEERAKIGEQWTREKYPT